MQFMCANQQFVTARIPVLIIWGFGLALIGCQQSDMPEPTSQAVETQAKPDSDKPPAQELRVPQASGAALSNRPEIVSPEQLKDGWIALFDGQTLFGWVANSETDWQVVDGAIVADSETPGLLLTTTKFNDYEFRCEIWLEPGGNSGLFLRTGPFPENPAKDCLEFNLCDGHETYPTGSLVGRDVAEKIVPIEGDWHQVHIVVNGPHFSARIDETPVVEAESPAFLKTSGRRIGLQQNDGEIRFRNIILRPLGLDSIMESESLDGWHAAPEGTKLNVANADGGVRLKGKGYLESDATYADFILQFQAKLNAADVNSGLFFRAQPSTADAPSNGYELQLQNTIANGDRTRPADYGDGFGTGAIFRRQAARYVNADDKQWFNVTLVARGNHFASWVNGLQVTDFTDTRPTDENPRRGRRDAAGHLSFQGHDEGTDISIRNMRIKEFGSGGDGGSGD